MDLVPYEGERSGSREDPTPREPVTLEEAKREVAEALKEILQLPESERSSAIKRFIRRWHPDKNKHRESFANEVTKFLLNEVECLKQGGVPGYHSKTSNQPPGGPPRGPPRKPPRPTWDDGTDYDKYFKKYRERQGRQKSRHPNWKEPDDEEEPANKIQARRWMRQAQEDSEAAACLFENAHFAFACFHCQQAVEKALKALMFAKGRLKKSDLEAHDILALAYRASQMDPSFRVIPNMVAAMHGYYIKTRYPHYQRGMCQNTIPAEMFSHQDSENAISKTEEILQLIEQVLN